MKPAKEKDLDNALHETLVSSGEFADWFLAQTSFSGERGQLDWARSNYVWGPVPVLLRNPETGEMETVVRESETDILVVYRLDDGRRIGLHIENKVGLGKFRPNQADFYPQRAAAWKGMERYGSYAEWDTVLVAPTAFRERYPAESAKFSRFISHEEIAAFIPLFDPSYDPGALAATQGHFHRLIKETLALYPGVVVPQLPVLIERELVGESRKYLAVSGMYGGFSYWLEGAGVHKHLIVESWSQIVEGSGQRHVIDATGIDLVDKGFV